MTARIIGLKPLPARDRGAAIDRYRLRRGETIAPCVGNGKCFDESDDVRIERPQSGRLRAAPVAMFPLDLPVFMTRWSCAAFGPLKRHGDCGRANGCVIVEIGHCPGDQFSCATPLGRAVSFAPGAAKLLTATVSDQQKLSDFLKANSFKTATSTRGAAHSPFGEWRPPLPFSQGAIRPAPSYWPDIEAETLAACTVTSERDTIWRFACRRWRAERPETVFRGR